MPVDAEAPAPRELPVIEIPLAAVDPTETWDSARFSLFGEVEP